MLRIFHYLPRMHLSDGGPVRSTMDLCTVLAAAGHQVTVLTKDGMDAPHAWRLGEPGTPRVRVVDPGPEVVALGGRAVGPVRTALAGADVLHLHNLWTPTSYSAAMTARRLGVPYVFSPRGVLDRWAFSHGGPKKRAYFRLVASRALRGAEVVLFTAAEEQEQARAQLPGLRGAVLPNVIGLDDYIDLPDPVVARRRWAPDGDDLLVLYLSRLDHKKGPDLFLHALAQARQAGVAARAVVAGPGEAAYVRSIQALAGQLGIAHAVRFVDRIEGREKVGLYRAADLFVLPTSQENFGRVLFEALASGTPVVTTRGVDVWKELEESGGAVIVDRTPAAVAAAIGAAAEPGRCREMGRRGREWALDYLDPDRLLRSYEELYSRVVAGGSHGFDDRLGRPS